MTDIAPTVTDAPANTRPFETLMTVEGRWTGDERYIMVEALTWDGLLPFLLTDGHGAELDDIQGWVTEIERVPGMTPDERFIIGRGVVYTDSEAGAALIAQLEAGAPIGVSVDLDAIAEGGVDPADPAAEPDAWYMVVEAARIRGLATCVIPAFAEALITLGTVDTATPVPAIDGPVALPADEMPIDEGPEEIIIVAAGHTITLPAVPLAEWFSEPNDVVIEGAMTVTDEGRVYGLLAPAHTPFIGNPNVRGVPMGNVDYSRFTRGEAIVEGGHRVVAGNITMGCGHTETNDAADAMAVRSAMMNHHDHSCSVVAQVAIGERFADPAGVWVAGALLPGVSAEQVQRMMACQLSGEWNGLPGGRYELLAALLVPVPAFAMGRRAASVTSRYGQLVASAIPVQFEDCGCTDLAECDDCMERRLGVDPTGAEVGRRLAGLEAQAELLAPLAVEALRRDMQPR